MRPLYGLSPDGNLQRYAIRENGTLNYFLWDGLNILQERNADGTLKEEHTHARTPIAGIGQLLESYRPGEAAANQKIYPIMDQRGTICKYIKSDGVTVVASREYHAFGGIMVEVGAWPGRFGYQGQAWVEIASEDRTQRLCCSPARVYDPADGRFVQPDASRRGNGFLLYNTYTYVASRPLSFVDVYGEQAEAVEKLPDLDTATTGEGEKLRLAALAIATAGPSVGAQKAGCKYADGSLRADGIGGKDGYTDKGAVVARLVRLAYWVEEKEDPKCCALVAWENSSSRLDGAYYLRTRDIYGIKGVAGDTRGRWTVDTVDSLDPKMEIVKVMGSIAYSADAPSYTKLFGRVKVKSSAVVDTRFKVCIYNVEDLEGVMVSPYKASDGNGKYVIGAIDVKAIACVDWQFKVTEDKDGNVTYG